jgi:hypothetical protein
VFVFSFSFSSLISSPTVCAPFFFSFFFSICTQARIDRQTNSSSTIFPNYIKEWWLWKAWENRQ